MIVPEDLPRNYVLAEKEMDEQRRGEDTNVTNRFERLPSHQAPDAGTLAADRIDGDSDSTSSTFGISGMDGFALASQPRRIPAGLSAILRASHVCGWRKAESAFEDIVDQQDFNRGEP